MVLYGIGIVLAGVLQAHRRFAGPALAPLLSSVVVAAAYLLFAVMGGSRTVAGLSTPAELVLGVGTTLGVVALSLNLLVPVRRLRLGLRPTLRFPVGAGLRVRRLALAGVLTLAGQQLVAAVAIRLANDGTPPGTQVVYFAGMTLFLVPWAALAVPLATSAYPGLAERAELGDDDGFRRSLAPTAVMVVVVVPPPPRSWSPWPARWPGCSSCTTRPTRSVATRDTILAFAPGLVGYGLVALLTRTLYARGLWKAPTVCVAGGWLLAASPTSPCRRSPGGPPRHRPGRGTQHRRHRRRARAARRRRPGGRRRCPAGLARTAGPALLGRGPRCRRGLAVLHALGADPVPDARAVPAIAVGLLSGATVLVIVVAVMMVTARGPLAATLRGLRAWERQEVHGD